MRPSLARAVIAAMCCLSGAAVVVRPAAADTIREPPSARTYVEGIDVSHHQNLIDWRMVASSGKQFAIAKATEGQTFDDPMFATNRSGAKEAGLHFGAYHFARPDTSANDAIIEADHFAAVAGYRSGEIKPTLDLEDNGKLSVAALQAWVRAFLKELKAKTGVKAMIYTSPNFWKTSMGDTTDFATHGYQLLWIANWDVSQPSVPANDWAGYGWTYWQWTDCETVPGITTGCVDGDRFNKQVVDGIPG